MCGQAPQRRPHGGQSGGCQSQRSAQNQSQGHEHGFEQECYHNETGFEHHFCGARPDHYDQPPNMSRGRGGFFQRQSQRLEHSQSQISGRGHHGGHTHGSGPFDHHSGASQCSVDLHFTNGSRNFNTNDRGSSQQSSHQGTPDRGRASQRQGHGPQQREVTPLGRRATDFLVGANPEDVRRFMMHTHGGRGGYFDIGYPPFAGQCEGQQLGLRGSGGRQDGPPAYEEGGW